MALLSDAPRQEIAAQFQRENDESCGIVKADLRATVDALDAWWESQAAAANAAIPQPARATLSTRQKVRLFKLLLDKRYEVA